MIVHEKLGIYKIKLPLPFRLNHINCYAIRGREGWWLLDTGLNTEQTRRIWQQFMADKGIGQDLRAIYLTHYHADHFGAAGYLQRITGAQVFIGAADGKAVRYFCQVTPAGTLQAEPLQALTDMFSTYGMPANFIENAIREMGELASSMQPFPLVSNLVAGSTVQLGDYRYHVVFTPGHSDGHICYFNEDFGVLISGDHILPKITSNISLWPNAHPDPLKNYLKSLQNILQLPVQLALPAHGEPFVNVKERIKQIQDHHRERLKLIKGLVARGATVYSICRRVFGENLNAHEVRFAVAETASHLMYMTYQGELEMVEQNGVKIFSDPTLTKRDK